MALEICWGQLDLTATLPKSIANDGLKVFMEMPKLPVLIAIALFVAFPTFFVAVSLSFFY